MVLRKDEPLEVRGHSAEPRKLSRAEASKLHIEDPAAIEATDTPRKGVLIFIGALIGLFNIYKSIYGPAGREEEI